MQRPRRSIVVYSITAVAIAVATTVRLALSEVLGEHLMYSMYFLAVSVAAWAGGIRPAMVTAIISSILASYIFSDPRGELVASNWEELCGLIIFLSVSLFIGIMAEISLKSSERARVAEQQKDDFLAILAHELRNPLAIIHYTNTAEPRSGNSTDDGRSGVINRQVQQLDQMIDDLLDISRVSRGKFRLEFEPIGVASIVDEALEEVQHLIDDRDHDLVVTRADDDLIAWGDPLRLQQIISNLLRNAARYTPRGGRIELNVFSEKDTLVLRICDNGQGIPKEMLSRVFDLHTQVQRSLETTGTGLGAGLALVRTLVELHGGKITAHSEGPNRGSEFIVRLPLYQPKQQPAGSAAREAS